MDGQKHGQTLLTSAIAKTAVFGEPVATVRVKESLRRVHINFYANRTVCWVIIAKKPTKGLFFLFYRLFPGFFWHLDSFPRWLHAKDPDDANFCNFCIFNADIDTS